MSVKPDRPIIRMALASGLSLASLCAFNPGSTAQAQGTAPAGKGMKLLKLTVTGNKRVPTADITSAMTLGVGQKVTKADLAANLNAIVDVYRRANVGAGFKQKMTIPHPGQVLIAYIIEEQVAPPPQAAAVLRVDRVAIEGNKQIKSEAIQSAITLKPGDPLDEAKVSANMQAILALYKKAGIGVQITPSATYPQPNHAILGYRIQEKAAE
jgi:outer membrane protein assembly factor BamA